MLGSEHAVLDPHDHVEDRRYLASTLSCRETHLKRDADTLAGVVERRAAAVAAVDGGVDLDRKQLRAAVRV